MSERTWNRREFGRAVAPALVAAPALATLAGGRSAPAADIDADGLWPEARAARDFYRRHLPAGHRLARPTLAAAGGDGLATRRATFAVLRDDSPVGHLEFAATFRPGQPRPLRQGTVVAGDWYAPSIANAFKAGRFA